MAGILDNKSRVMDVIVTREGKRQIGSGDLKVAYASFTDNSTYYDKTSITGSFDEAVNRIFYESTSYAFDQITIEKNDAGAVIPFAGFTFDNNGSNDRAYMQGGNLVINGSVTAINSKNIKIIDDILKFTTDNFRKQMIIASRDPIDDSSTFELSTNTIKFNYGNRGPIVGDELFTTIDQAASVFTDKRFCNATNFMFMPPIAKSIEGDITLGQYKDVRQVTNYSYEDVIKELVGGVPDQPICPNQEIEFVETSSTNDICIQAFEVGDSLRKLDMVDFGEYYVKEDDKKTQKRVLFVGKIFVDSYGATNFANIFTIILE